MRVYGKPLSNTNFYDKLFYIAKNKITLLTQKDHVKIIVVQGIENLKILDKYYAVIQDINDTDFQK